MATKMPENVSPESISAIDASSPSGPALCGVMSP